MTTKWSKGPWTFESFSFGSPNAPISHKKIVGPTELDTSRKLIAEVHMQHNTHEADGQLIASAPQLYEALAAAETILILLKEEVAELGFRSENVLPKVQAALRQARGEQ